MFRKFLKAFISMVLALAIGFCFCTNAFAASSKKTYIKDMVISYGKTADEAKAWLTQNGYEVLDYDINEGADDTFSTKRAVYIGYTTTDDPEEAITDMRLMNMKGGYSVQDYQMLLEEQKANIRVFIDNFIVAVNEYRENYGKGQGRAVAAHDMLNLLYDDDTQQYVGDLLLNKVKEEYTDAEWNALSEEEQGKIADMTTILMQANSDAVLCIEQTIATASDNGDKLWLERYESAGTYDDMLDELMDSQNLTINEAEKQLAAEYDEDARSIASKFEEYKTYLENYTNAEIKLSSSEEEVKAYQTAHEDFDYISWFAAGSQYEVLSALMNDDISLLELVTSDDYDVQNADSYMLYPLVAALTDGQRACLDFLPMYQIVALGINGDEAIGQAMEEISFGFLEGKKNSVYDGVDRSIFGGEVALTNKAIRLQAATGKEAVQGMLDYISVTSYVLYGTFGLSVLGTAVAWKLSAKMSALAEAKKVEASGFGGAAADAYMTGVNAGDLETTEQADKAARNLMLKNRDALRSKATYTTWSKVFKYAGIAMSCVSVVLFALSIWSTYNDIKAYYNAEFTPIPMHMVDENVNDNDEKVYTYYTAVKCNRVEAGMVTDATKLLEDYGDINGDVGRQWVALYTTKDKAAGNPITTVPQVKYKNSNLPDEECTALSMFGEDVAQNLTNEQAGYTYDDDMGGIYMFFNTDKNAFAGSVFSNGTYILVSAAAAIVVGCAAFFAGMGVQKKKVRGAAV